MIFQKGFSLLEVLLSLILLTTLSLALLKQNDHSRQWLVHLELRAKASQYLDQMDESLLAGISRLSLGSYPYRSETPMHWFKARKRSALAVVNS